MEERKTVKNDYGVDIVVCCASCMSKGFKNEKERKCLRRHGAVTYPSEFCDDWRMAENLQRAGRGGGRVRKRAWLKYVEEHGKSDQTIKDFERKNGSRFLCLK